MSDPAKYRTREEVEQIRREQDPIDRLRLKILQLEPQAESRLHEIEDAVKREIGEAVDYARRAPEPDPAELFTDVYV
jgi:pyruvate dehydrogenase E1 component alpha subunit